MNPYTSIDPTTGEVYGTYPVVDQATVDDAVDRAHAAYLDWRERDVRDRAAALARAAVAIRADVDALATILTQEMGKPLREARTEVDTFARIVEYYAQEGPALLEPELLHPASGDEAHVRLQPTGVLLGVMPWNFPYYQVARFAAPNLLLGNTVLLKHARSCPRSALAVERVLHGAGVPTGAYVNLFADTSQLESIIVDDRVQGVSVTGSERAGAAVAEIAGRHLTKVVLELGGSDPFLVLDDHQLDATVTAAVVGRMTNAGQVCSAAKRFIVVDDVFDRFVERYAHAVSRLTVGDPRESTTEIGPLSSAAALAEVRELVDEAVAKGATVVCGGTPSPRDGHFYEPTVLVGVTEEMRADREEIFGPVAVVYRVPSATAAVELANASSYGLGAAVFSGDPDLAAGVATRLDVGMVTINGTNRSQPDLPFGGVKRSGMGRELGRFGLEEFANKKLIRTPRR